MEIVDFTNLPTGTKRYGEKDRTVIYIDNTPYILKFPTSKRDGKDDCCNCISEYIGCHIFEMLEIPVQNTLLGTYETKQGKKIVVACKDFTFPDQEFIDFAFLEDIILPKNIGAAQNYRDALKVISQQQLIKRSVLINFFWQMFVVDAFIGNWDRHNRNWGILRKQKTREIGIAPIFDCSSCLWADLGKEQMEEIVDSKDYKGLRAPKSIMRKGDNKIRYENFTERLKDEDCNQALEKILSKLSMPKIQSMIFNIPCISDKQKQFYMATLTYRKKILYRNYEFIHEKRPK